MPVFPNTVTSKMPRVGTTIFTVMSKLADDHQAINLSQGFPGYEVDPVLIELVSKHLREGRNQYAPMAGIMSLRERIAEKMAMHYGAIYHPETEITVTSGATQAIFTAIMALVHEGDEVVLFTPAYDCYAPAIELAGGKPVYVPLKANDFSIDWKQVKKVVGRHTRMILINTPHNPSGALLNEKDMQELVKLTNGSNTIVLSDEVYEHVVFDGEQHASAAHYPELAERSLCVYSFGKTFHATGWKMGYVCGPANLMAEFRKVHQFNVFTANTPFQYAIADYMALYHQRYHEIAAGLQRSRDLFLDALKGSRFKTKASRGTYFQLLDYSKISDLPDTEMAKKLTIENGVASIPVSVFYHIPLQQKVLRFCFAKTDEWLLRAAERLSQV